METQMQESIFKNRLLEPCDSTKTFYTHQGHIIWSIRELISDLENMDDYTFRYHVNMDHNKNDFADWIRLVLLDQELAMELEGVMGKQKYIEIIRKRVKEIEDLSHTN